MYSRRQRALEDNRLHEIVSRSTRPRRDTSLEVLASLRPAFHARGSVTAGNSSQMSDGAAAVIVMSADRARQLGLTPLGRFVAFATAGVEPERFGIGPVPAIKKVLKLAGLTLDQIDLIELNEAFAAQVLACLKELPIDPDRLNVNGGAIALGHPLGCTGAKLTTTLLHEMKRRNARYGMVSMCVGGGMGAAGIFESCRAAIRPARSRAGMGPARKRKPRANWGGPSERSKYANSIFIGDLGSARRRMAARIV